MAKPAEPMPRLDRDPLLTNWPGADERIQARLSMASRSDRRTRPRAAAAAIAAAAAEVDTTAPSDRTPRRRNLCKDRSQRSIARPRGQPVLKLSDHLGHWNENGTSGDRCLSPGSTWRVTTAGPRHSNADRRPEGSEQSQTRPRPENHTSPDQQATGS